LNDFYDLFNYLVIVQMDATNFNLVSIAKTDIAGKNINLLPSCHSTNDFCLDLIKKNNAIDGQITITFNQTNGRGQRGNKWLSEKGENLTFSLTLWVDYVPLHAIFFLNMAVSLAIIDFLNMLVVEKDMPKFKIKWPNDIYYLDKKVGGVLIENVIKKENFWSVIGIGININQTNFKYLSATSLANIYGKTFDFEIILTELIQKIDCQLKNLKKGSLDLIKSAYLRNLYRFQQTSFFRKREAILEGKIIEVTEDGLLGIEINNSIHYFDIKEIVFVN
jgi:BirA family transcriptional regulator, biotin operon repressor / biotin---[acetyl-CoA-carboxylase] ligase